MKLNPDCIRDILLCIEESLPSVRYIMTFNKESISTNFPSYSYDEVVYHLRQCELHGFFYQSSHTLDNVYTVVDLSPLAHSFLANIREDNIWNDVKSVSSKVGSKSIDTLIQIASGVVTTLIHHQLGI